MTYLRLHSKDEFFNNKYLIIKQMSDTMCSFMWKIYIHGSDGSSIWKNRILFAISFTIHVSIFRFVKQLTKSSIN